MSSFLDRCVTRIQNDLHDIFTDPVDGIFVCPDDNSSTVVHAIIVGPEGTPYHNGFFYFLLQYPVKYPLVPPSVKLMTTGDGRVSFGHHLFNSGHVCLSIIGTWNGPQWTPIMTTKSLLLSIQTMLCPDPFFDEPRFNGKKEQFKELNEVFNSRIKYDTLTAAVHDMVHKSLIDQISIPLVLKHLIIRLFYERFDYYDQECKRLIEENPIINGEKHSTESLASSSGASQTLRRSNRISTMTQDRSQRINYDYCGLYKRLCLLKKQIRMEDNMSSELYDSLKSSYINFHHK
jgi:ubiquitin-protein ligase